MFPASQYETYKYVKKFLQLKIFSLMRYKSDENRRNYDYLILEWTEVSMVSLIIPAYNEEKIIAQTVLFCQKYLSYHLPEYQLIVVDDGSTDNTLEEASRVKGVNILSYPRNRGKGYAVRQGMQVAGGDMVFFTDADLPYHLKYLQSGLRLMEQGADVVIGNRDHSRTGYPPVRKMLSRGCQALSGLVLQSESYDTQCGFKGVSRRVVRNILPMAQIDDFGFDMELLYLAEKYGMNIKSIPVTMQEHRQDTHVHVLSDSYKIAKDMLKIRQLDRDNMYHTLMPPVGRRS